MAGLVKSKTVCFIASAVIAWGLFEVGDAIVAWLDYKFNDTEIYTKKFQVWNLKISASFIYFSFCYFVAFVSFATKNTKLAVLSWMLVYLDPFGCPFWLSLAIKIVICNFFTLYIYKTCVEEIYKHIKEKSEESDKYLAKIEEYMKTKEGEKNTISEKDRVTVV